MQPTPRVCEPHLGWPSGDPYEAGLQQIGQLLDAMGVGPGMRDIILALIAEHAPPDAARSAMHRQQRAPLSIGEVARLYYRQSTLRNDVLGAPVVNEGGWHMLLDLFAAAEEGRSISVSSLCIASGIPATTALNHIRALAAAGLIERSGDPDDRRRTWLRLTPQGRERMAEMIARFTVPRPVPLTLGP